VPERDFDEAIRERGPIKFTIGGSDYSLPAALPATKHLSVARANREMSTLEKDERFEFLFALLVGEENSKQIMATAEFEQISQLLLWLMELYLGGERIRNGDAKEEASTSDVDPLSASIS